MRKQKPVLSDSATAARQPRLVERIIGAIILALAVVVLVTATMQWFGDTARIRNKAEVKKITTVAPLKEAWTLAMPAKMKDPRSVQVWGYADSQDSLAAQDAATGVSAKLAENEQLVLVKGTDGKAQTQAIALVDETTGTAKWSKTYDDLPLDYCLKQLWQSSITCESDAAKKVVRIDPSGNVAVGDLPNDIWDLATGEHVLGAIFDQFLVVPIAVGEGNSAGAQAVYITPDFAWKGKFPLMVPNAQAAKPLLVQTRGSVTLLGVTTSNQDGSNRQNTWSYSQIINTKIGSFDTTKLGSESQISMLEAGFFASADPQSAAEVDWQVHGSDGAVVGEGKCPSLAAQALHAQLRAGLRLDTDSAMAALKSGKVPVLMPNRTYFLAEGSDTCASWPGCAAKAWTTGDGVTINLKSPGTPLASDGSKAVFTEGNGGLLSYGVVDGKFLWEGIAPPLKDAATTGDTFVFGSGLGQLAQLGDLNKGSAKAVLRYLTLP
ncbi:hypothetical protein [uncultured Mobiluncus sp.]|uniref:hypothetical protein n=1 Tax=uncultured Mobiluncus sp. TaxID=293425 RepID=UPI00260C118C|nr:hypothetical protein [uncultured Mobiluncus sp.]